MGRRRQPQTRRGRRKRNSLKSSSSQQIASNSSSEFYLPDDCWESIFKFIIRCDNKFISRYYLNSLSVVSKQFVSVSNRFIFKLTIFEETHPFLPRLLKRFTNLTSLKLKRFSGDMNALLCEISRFPLNLTSLKLSNLPTFPANGLRAFSQNITTLTSLTCSSFKSIHGNNLLLIADCFPLLEKLDLRCPRKLKNHKSLLNGLEVLFSTLFKLRKVNLSRHHYINDQSIFHMLDNSKLLEEIVIFHCSQITFHGIHLLRQGPPTLRYLSYSSPFGGGDCSYIRRSQ